MRRYFLLLQKLKEQNLSLNKEDLLLVLKEEKKYRLTIINKPILKVFSLKEYKIGIIKIYRYQRQKLIISIRTG